MVTQQSTPLAAADIKIVEPSGRIVESISSDNGGRFHVISLPAGSYRVVAALEGFVTTTQDVVVSVEHPTVVVVDLPTASERPAIPELVSPGARRRAAQNSTTSPFFGTFYNAEPRRLRLQVRFER